MCNYFKKICFLVIILPLFVFILQPNFSKAAEQSGQAIFNYYCSALIPFNMELTLNYTAPTTVKSGKEFYIKTQTSSAPEASLVDLLRLLGAQYVIGESLFTPAVNNGKYLPADLSLDERTWTAIDKTPIPATGEFRTTVPGDGPGELGPFIAEADSGEVEISAGTINTKLFVYNSEDPDSVPILQSESECQPLAGQDLKFVSITIDNEAPVITLNGDNPMVVKQGDSYVELGATAQDNIDGDLSDKIEVSGNVDTNTIGTYVITYTVSDDAGNVATVERIVNVVEPFGNWYVGEGPPSDNLGSNGDSYLDITTGDVYKRDTTTWKKVGNIRGNDGKQGSTIHTGSGAPKAELGNIGDLYLDTKTGDLYEKTSDGWVKVANLQGPSGPQGPKGDSGSSGDSGPSGDDDGTSGTKPSTGSDKDGKGSPKGGKLPKTATSLPMFILVGALLSLAGGVIFLRRQKALE